MLNFNQDSEAPTQIIELPVIVVNDTVQILEPEMIALTETTLKDLALSMGGQYLYLKVRATFTPVENQLCTHKSCYRPAKPETLNCGDH